MDFFAYPLLPRILVRKTPCRSMTRLAALAAFIFFIALFFGSLPKTSNAAIFSVGPSSGSFIVGSTFDVQIFLDTQKESVNAIELSLKYPADKLQLVSPLVGHSIVGVWTSQPHFNNTEGRLDLQGGIVGGISVERGLIATVTFRVKSTGPAILKFLDSSKALLNDGKGTDVLRQSDGAVFDMMLPPPQGPIVASETNPDQSKWYRNSSAVFKWALDGHADGYSYVLNKEPVDVPDNISEGDNTSVSYKSVESGTSYFHVKALRGGVWGGTTHFVSNIDADPPAVFPIEILPGSHTNQVQPIINFATTDALSGLSHYELKIIPLKAASAINKLFEQGLFIETQSPYIPPALSVGTYDVIVRAYDNASNYREITKRLQISSGAFALFADDGLILWWSDSVVPWRFVFLFALLALSLLLCVAWRIRGRHVLLDEQRLERKLPRHVKEQLEELKAFKVRYGKIAVVVLVIISSVLMTAVPSTQAGTSPATTSKTANSTSGTLQPPIITTASRNISNEEIFYIGGTVNIANTEITIYLQDAQNGEAYSEKAIADKNGMWFYRHNTFLSAGEYLLWVQARAGEEVSPPSPQVTMSVESTALQIGSSRLSLVSIYAILLIVLSVFLMLLVVYIVIQGVRARRRHRLLSHEIKEAEESIRRGFAILRRDVKDELETITKMKLRGPLSEELEAKEAQLAKDLNYVERFVGKEIWDIERVEEAN